MRRVEIAFIALVFIFTACDSGTGTGDGDISLDDTIDAEAWDLEADVLPDVPDEEIAGDPVEDGTVETVDGVEIEDGDAAGEVPGEPDGADAPDETEETADMAEIEDEDAAGDAVEEDPAEEEPPDPCDPNPCEEAPADYCLDDLVTLVRLSEPGACTPSGDGYACDFPSGETDCSETDDMACLDGVCTNTIEQVRASEYGAVSFAVNKVHVSYVRPAAASDNGFYIQRFQEGPGLFMYLGDTAPAVEQGNMIDVEITNFIEYHGLQEADVFTITSNDGVAGDVGFLVQDFTADGTVDESTESELIRINNAQVVSGWVETYDVDFGTSSSTAIHFTDFSSLMPRMCPGMVLDVLAPAGEWDGMYDLTACRAEDFLMLDNAACGAIDNSNWDFEDWAFSNPPDDFERMTSQYSAGREDTIVGSGSHSVNITWTSTANQDFYQAWFTPVSAGTVTTYHVWFYDNDIAGRARTGLQPYDISEAPLTRDYGSYTSDGDAWRELDHVFTPAVDGFFRAFVRLYDVTGGWDGDATLYLDDWAITGHEAFNVEDGLIDVWVDTDPSAAPLIAGTPGETMEVYGAINDEGLLYLATHEAATGLSDHLLYAWVGEVDTVVTVPAPWSKTGTVASAPAGSYLFVLLMEEQSGYCEVRWWDTGWAAVAAACGYDGTADGSGYVEATVDLVTVLGLGRAGDLPGPLGLAVAPYESWDTGAVVSSSQVPACTVCDGNIDDDEVAVTHRASVLVGKLKP
ncbi:MAG: hypothetical protein ABIJ56_05375 [Pseudomonadota bacterium]